MAEAMQDAVQDVKQDAVAQNARVECVKISIARLEELHCKDTSVLLKHSSLIKNGAWHAKREDFCNSTYWIV